MSSTSGVLLLAGITLLAASPASAFEVTHLLSSVDVLRKPIALAVAPDGTAYVGSERSRNIFRVETDGSVEAILDGFEVQRVALGPSETVYFYDRSGVVRRLTASGETEFVTSRSPVGLDLLVAPDDTVYVSWGGSEDVVTATTSSGTSTMFAGLDNPWGLAYDAGGNLYATGSKTDNALKRTPGGVITEIIDATGDGLGNSLDDPRSVAVDVAGNVYVAGYRSHNVFQITPAGVITEIIDASGDGMGATLAFPLDVTVDANGDVVVVSTTNENVFRLSAGTVTRILSPSGDGQAPLDGPVAVDADASGDVYVLGNASQNLFRIPSAGPVTQILDAGGEEASPSYYLKNPLRMEVREGTIWVAGAASRTVVRRNPDGSALDVFDDEALPSSVDTVPRALTAPAAPNAPVIVCGGGGFLPWYGYVASIDAPSDYTLIYEGNLHRPNDCLLDPSGDIYVADGFTGREVLRVSPGGSAEVLIDITGDGLGNDLDEPFRLARAADGTVYVAGLASDNVLGVDSSGTVFAALDASGDGLGHVLDKPTAVAVDGGGNLYVTGFESDNVFRVTPAGVVTQIADASGDGMGNALDGPEDVVVTEDGAAYVAGGLSDNVFVIDPGGEIRLVMDASGDGDGHPLERPFDLVLEDELTLYVLGLGSENLFRVDLFEPAEVPVPGVWLAAAGACLAALARTRLTTPRAASERP